MTAWRRVIRRAKGAKAAKVVTTTGWQPWHPCGWSGWLLPLTLVGADTAVDLTTQVAVVAEETIAVPREALAFQVSVEALANRSQRFSLLASVVVNVIH